MTSQTMRHGIVVGADGSPASKVAVDWAARDAALRRVPLTLVHVVPASEMRMWVDVPLPEEYWQQSSERSHDILAEARAVAERATADGRPLTIIEKSESGNTTATLIELTKDAELAVVGSRGLGKWGRRLLGSVSTGLVHHAHCPVAVIHDEDPLAENPAHAPVVVGVDGSPASEAATEIAFDEASRRRVRLTVVHTWNDVDYEFPEVKWTDLTPRGEQILSERLAGYQERYPDVIVQRVLTRDNPAHQLLLQSESAQLLVVGSHGRGGFTGMLLGSVSSEVVQSARTPVIVARKP